MLHRALDDEAIANWGVPLVLVVDPDPATASFVREVAGASAMVCATPDAYQALHFMRANQVAVLVLEMHLPGANGLDLLHRLEAGHLPACVIALAHGPGTQKSAREAGAALALCKPITLEVLREALFDALARAGGAPIVLPSLPRR